MKRKQASRGAARGSARGGRYKAADFGSQAAANCLCVLLLLTRSYPSGPMLSFICITPPSPLRSFVYFIFCKLSLLCHGQSVVVNQAESVSAASQLRTQSWHNWTGEMLNAVDTLLPSGGSSVSAH